MMLVKGANTGEMSPSIPRAKEARAAGKKKRSREALRA